MNHLAAISRIIFLEVDSERLIRRIHNFESRGIAKAKDQSFEELFQERRTLYKKYAEITVNGDDLDQEELALNIARMVRATPGA
jgi:shikimate kinase